MIRSTQFILFLLTTIVAYLIWIVVSTPSAEDIKKCITTKMYKVSLCEKSRHYVRLSEVSPYLKNLIVIAEDSSFYSHSGFDEAELKNSFVTNFSAKKLARGGSTITQQLAKNVFLKFNKSISRKLREALLAVQIEKILNKNQILEKYLNVIEFGRSTYGIKPAALYYFQKDAASLNLLESAFLVFLVPNPKQHSHSFSAGRLSPYARYRVLELCYKMYRYKKISHEQYLAAKEFVDEFPWSGLSGEQLSALSGASSSFSYPEILPDEELTIPENDESLSPVDAPETTFEP